MPSAVSVILAAGCLCGTVVIVLACSTSFWLVNPSVGYHTGLWKYCRRDQCGPIEEDRSPHLPSKYVVMLIRTCLMVTAGAQIIAAYCQCARLFDSVWRALANPVVWTLTISVLSMAVSLSILAARVVPRRKSIGFGWSYYVATGYISWNVLSLLLLVVFDRRKSR